MLSQPFLTRKPVYSSIMSEYWSKTIWIVHDAMSTIGETPLTLTFELTLVTY